MEKLSTLDMLLEKIESKRKTSKRRAGLRGGTKVLAGIAYDPEIAHEEHPRQSIGDEVSFALRSHATVDVLTYLGSGVDNHVALNSDVSERAINFGHSFGIHHEVDLNTNELSTRNINEHIHYKP